MTSPSPLEFGQYYHIYNRGNNREDLFFDVRNYQHFLDLYARYIPTVADTYAYCLLRNHFHFLVRIKTEEEQELTLRVSETLRVSGRFKPKRPSQQFGNLFNAYAKAINKAYDRTGSLFETPFGRVLVSSESHLVHLVVYIHQNPQKHGLVTSFDTWPHSSYCALLSWQPTRLEREEVLPWFHGPAAFREAHRGAAAEARIAPLVAGDVD
ncbi:transposase [Chloroflexota bacterium]